MKRIFCSAAILAVTIGTVPSALAADPSPIGDWLVKDGYANIRIDICNGKLWGIVAWEKTPGVDKDNPDVTKRGRPTLGMPIIMGFTPTKPNKWEGEIYNSENGKMYNANVSMADENTLDLEGCLWVLCQTQKWTRVKAPPPNAPPLPPIKGVGTPPGKQAAKKGAAHPPSDTCMRIADDAAALEKTNAKK